MLSKPDAMEKQSPRGGAATHSPLKPMAVIAAIGIVYGDIGTSPLYVFQAIAKPGADISTPRVRLEACR